jgi:rRNA processing protein Krr1/Pno1
MQLQQQLALQQQVHSQQMEQMQMMQQVPMAPERPLLAEFHRFAAELPAMYRDLTMKIKIAESREGNVRHDILVEKSSMGYLIGGKGKTYKELVAKTGCEIFLLDKEPPAGVPADQRLVVLVGTSHCVTAAYLEAMEIIKAAQSGSAAGGASAVGNASAAMMGGMGGMGGNYMGGMGDSMNMAGALASMGGGMGGGFTPANNHSLSVSLDEVQMLPEFTKRYDNFPTATSVEGQRSASVEAVPGNVRHDLVVDKSVCGSLIGQGGTTFKQITSTSGAKIFIIDKEAPPGEDPNHRLVALIGTRLAVSHAYQLINKHLSFIANKRGMASNGITNAPAVNYGPGRNDTLPSDIPMLQDFHKKYPDFPTATSVEGSRANSAEEIPGNVRHDVLVDKSMCGSLIGQGGNTFKQLTSTSGARIIILDKEPPPGEELDQRLVVLIGTPTQVSHAHSLISRHLQFIMDKRAGGKKRGLGEDAFGPPAKYAGSNFSCGGGVSYPGGYPGNSEGENGGLVPQEYFMSAAGGTGA